MVVGLSLATKRSAQVSFYFSSPRVVFRIHEIDNRGRPPYTSITLLLLDDVKMPRQLDADDGRERRGPILVALAGADDDLMPCGYVQDTLISPIGMASA